MMILGQMPEEEKETKTRYKERERERERERAALLVRPIECNEG